MMRFIWTKILIPVTCSREMSLKNDREWHKFYKYNCAI